MKNGPFTCKNSVFFPTLIYKIELSCRKKRVVIIEREREREKGYVVNTK